MNNDSVVQNNYFFYLNAGRLPDYLYVLVCSAARKFEQKGAKFLKTPKGLHQSNFKIQKYLQQSFKNYAKNRFK